MAKLVVEVLDAIDLMPKDGQGSASPYVQVEFDDQRHRTSTKLKDVNPQWNEKLLFHINNPRDLLHKTILVAVYNERRDQGHLDQKDNFLGHVKISGMSVPSSESEASVQRYPLDKRGLFSHIRGDISLKIYAVQDGSFFVPPTATNNGYNSTFPTAAADNDSAEGPAKLDNIFNNNSNRFDEEHHHQNLHHDDNFDELKKSNQKKEKEVRTFHSIGTTTPGPIPQPPGHSMNEKGPSVETRTNFARAGPAVAMQMQFPRQKPQFGLEETRPPVAAHLRYRGGDKTTTTYDLVEQMHYLYVNVVKARDLPPMDVSGSLDPYVEVKLGNYKGVTKHLEKNQNPVWNQIFAFSKHNLQSNFLEIVVKDKDFVKDDFVGRMVFDITELPVRFPPDSPLAPLWYKLESKKGEKVRGEIMLAVWIGTQADESFPEAWHSDAHNVGHTNLSNTRSKVYFSPRLYYLRVVILQAQDLIPSERGRMPDPCVRIQLGNQTRATRTCQRTVNPVWGDELFFVASEPFEDFIIVSVDDKIGPGKDEPLGKMIIPVRNVPRRHEMTKLPDAVWFNLHRPSLLEEEEKKKEIKFASKILILFCLEAGYHVLDETTHFSSDLQPSSKHLRKESIGILELGILSAKNLLPMKGQGRTTDAYCVAKYGNKWVRTRTLLNTSTPRWNEQYTWEVFDPCTVITIGVFDNCNINGSNDARDERIGKVRIRLSTLETNRVYTHYYPLLVLQPPELKKTGELHLALRFTCTAWVNMVAKYGKPLLPKMHYVQPIPIRHVDMLRHHAMQIVAARLSRAEPPLRREVVGYMLDVDIHMFSIRRSKANFQRIMSVLMGITYVCKWFNDICHWKNPITTCLVHILFLILVCYPEMILPTIFLYLFVIGIWKYRFRPRHPPHMDARLSRADFTDPDELDEEFDTFPSSRPADTVRYRYDRLRGMGGRVQTVIGDLATQGERLQSILSWRDPRATAIFIVLALIWAVVLYVTPLQVIAVLLGLYWLRHPRFRRKLPSVPANFFKRLPAKTDQLL